MANGTKSDRNMDEANSGSAGNADEPKGGRRYHAPTLRHLGSVRDLTAGTGSAGPDIETRRE
jgi:hypothetical protein